MTTPTIREPGIWFGLDEDAYHADGALGSTSVKQLLTSAPDYWWHSPLNPLRPDEKEKDHLTFGHAMHKRVLEGAQAFDARYIRAPEPEGLLVTDADVTAWLEKNHDAIQERLDRLFDYSMDRGGGMGLTTEEQATMDLVFKAAEGKFPKSKAGKIGLIRIVDPSVRILDAIRSDAEAAGKLILKAEDYDRIITASAIITASPDFSTAFDGGMPEVSIFWRETVEGVEVPCKARIDFLKQRANVDLKTAANPLNLPFDVACRRAIASYRYDIQAEHYRRGRSMMPGLISAGAVHGDHDPEWLARVVAQEQFASVVLFVQSIGAPLVWGATISPENPILGIARADREQALLNFARAVTEFGADRAWLPPAPLTELDVSDMPAWWGQR